MRRIVLICDNLSVHRGKKVQAWLAKHRRFEMFFLLVHCSWMNQIEQFFSIVQRKRLTASRFASVEELERQLLLFIKQWNQSAKPFAWTRQSFDKVLAKVEQRLPEVQLLLAARCFRWSRICRELYLGAAVRRVRLPRRDDHHRD